MNKQIQELSDKALNGETIYYTTMPIGFVEKFAEMIIEECVACCGAQADKKNIRKRFGLPVESNIQYPGEDPQGYLTQYTRELNIKQ